MIQVNVTNASQRSSFHHAEGPLTCGRSPECEGGKLLIDDIHVSREQFVVEERPGGKIRLENRGRVVMSLAGGIAVPQGNSRDVDLPVRLTVGKTVVDIVAVAGATPDSAVDPSRATLEGGGPVSVGAMTAKRVAKSYPYTLAYSYRLLSGIATPAELYKEQLRLAENLVSFVASVAMALLEEEQFDVLNQKIQEGALSCWRGGISPGDWLSLAIHAIDQLPQDDASTLVSGLKGLQINKDKRGFGKLVRELIKAKNDHKHDRGPSIEAEYRSACQSVREVLDEAFGAIEFFEDHPMRLVQDVNPRRRGQEIDVVFLKCMGDHPGFETEQAVHGQSLRKGDLYIEREPGRLVPLYPFIHATICHQCKAREFFFIDRLDVARSADQRATAGLKSFDRGHTGQDDDIGRELQEIFGGA
jgi:hypothetical protein